MMSRAHRPGTPVRVQDAYGRWHNRVVAPEVASGVSFPVAWLSTPEEWEAAWREGRPPVAVPWPADTVEAME